MKGSNPKRNQIKLVKGDCVYLTREAIVRNPGIVPVFGRNVVNVKEITYQTKFNGNKPSMVDIRVHLEGAGIAEMRMGTLEKTTQKEVDRMLRDLRGIINGHKYDI